MDKIRLERVTVDGAWLTVFSDIINGTTLSADKFQDKLRLRFRMEPIRIWNRCDSCGVKLALDHALQCKKGRLVFVHHNNMADEWGAMCAAALTPKYVSQKPLINYGWWSSMGKGGDQEETKVGGK